MFGKRKDEELLRSEGLLEFLPHTRRKLEVLEEYLQACLKFRNFYYVDTHGGTGLIKINDRIMEGSAIKAAELFSSTPTYVIEVDPKKVQQLRLVAQERGLDQLRIIEGDCNREIPRLLKEDLRGKKFILFFVDPDWFIYRKGKIRVFEFTPVLLDTISTFSGSELLFTLIVQAIHSKGYIFRSFDPRFRLMKRHLEGALGEGIVDNSKESHSLPLHWSLVDWFIKRYIKTSFKPRYQFGGALLIKSEKGVPQYYLVFGTNNKTGAEIMRNVMKRVWGDQVQRKDFPMPPLELFMFDERLTRCSP